MRPVLTAAEASRLDAASSVPVGVLMERAGLAVSLAAAAMGAGYGIRVVVLAGPGNNGGDGYVAARYLRRRGAAVKVLALARPRTGAARQAERAARWADVAVEHWGPPEPADLIVDALFGGGQRGGLPSQVRPWLDHPAPVLAVDIPSGVDLDSGSAAEDSFRAAATVTFHALKVGHVIGEGPDRCGRLVVADIGLSGGEPAMRLAEEEDAPRPSRSRTTHKWAAGAVLVIGGSPGLVGAPILAARSALAFGAGAVGLAVPGGLFSVAATIAPELLGRSLGGGERLGPESADAAADMAHRFDVVVLGPGLGPKTGGFGRSFAQLWHGPLVLDADGLNGIDLDTLARRKGPTVLTPHAGEFRRLAGAEADHERASALSEETGAVVLLKGNPTFVASPELWVVNSGGPELATIGTGDVLAGMVAALWARGLGPAEAARSGAYWHGRAGSQMGATGSRTALALADLVGRWAW